MNHFESTSLWNSFKSNSRSLTASHPYLAIVRSNLNPKSLLQLTMLFYLAVYLPLILTVWLTHNMIGNSLVFLFGSNISSVFSSTAGLPLEELSGAVGDCVLNIALLPVTIPLTLAAPLTGIMEAVIIGIWLLVALFAPVLIFAFIFKLFNRR